MIPVFIDIPHPTGPNTRSCRDDFAERFERVVWANGWPDDPHDHRVFNFHPDLPEIAYYMVSPSIDGTDELWPCGGAAIERYVEPHHIQAVLARIHRSDAVAPAKAGMRGSGKRLQSLDP